MAGKRLRRPILIATACCLLAGNLMWLPRHNSAGPDYLIEQTQSVAVLNTSAENVPAFASKLRRWTLNGQVIPSIIPTLKDDDPEGIGPDSIGLAATIRLEEDSSEAARQAMVLLASEGVCQVAIFAPLSKQSGEKSLEAPVFRVLSVRNDEGQLQRCRDRVKVR